MTNNKIIISSYLPSKLNKKPENFGNLRMKVKNLSDTKVFADTEDLKKLRRKKLAQDFIDLYTQGNVTSKAKFCKTNKMSVQTLNKGLQENGVLLKSKNSDSPSEENFKVKEKTKSSNKNKEEKELKKEIKEVKNKKEDNFKGGMESTVKRGNVDDILKCMKI